MEREVYFNSEERTLPMEISISKSWVSNSSAESSVWIHKQAFKKSGPSKPQAGVS